MRLSDAMMLGSTLVKMKPADWDTCALGVAGTSMGVPLCQVTGKAMRSSAIKDLWPWLRNKLTTKEYITDYAVNEQSDRVWMRFDFLVCEGAMTFEQLVDYVRSIEPECGECNRFECSCKTQAEPQGAESWVPFHS